MSYARITLLGFLTLGAGALSGCNHDSYQRNEGVTSYAGNAIAANTAMQMVDPWPEGVGDTDLETPPSAGTGSPGAGAGGHGRTINQTMTSDRLPRAENAGAEGREAGT
ncbi:MAG: hypothetical protein H6890_01830 [Brucellaceae bacterium]|nr:hypothetical protein [Brucellaceae bacterium]